MAVTELALLHFKAEEDNSIKTGLVQAQQAQEEHSKHKVQFLRQFEDPSCFYLLAGWESLETHIAQRVHYQGQLAQLGDRVGVDWKFHLDADFERSEASEDIEKVNELVKGVEVRHVHLQKWE